MVLCAYPNLHSSQNFSTELRAGEMSRISPSLVISSSGKRGGRPPRDERRNYEYLFDSPTKTKQTQEEVGSWSQVFSLWLLWQMTRSDPKLLQTFPQIMIVIKYLTLRNIFTQNDRNSISVQNIIRDIFIQCNNYCTYSCLIWAYDSQFGAPHLVHHLKAHIQRAFVEKLLNSTISNLNKSKLVLQGNFHGSKLSLI